jgi:hypothetical protein
MEGEKENRTPEFDRSSGTEYSPCFCHLVLECYMKERRDTKNNHMKINEYTTPYLTLILIIVCMFVLAAP